MTSSLQQILARAGSLPVVRSLTELQDALRRHSSAVLVAPPGAGKTTVVPLALAQADWLGARRIIMLEPRRIAARAAARRMAWLLGQPVGETAGYRIRNETVVGDNTRVEVVTEGVLTRILQSDPALEDYGLVIFDEFHERNLHGDLGLALTMQARDIVRQDLRILVMSATLDVDAVARVLDNPPVIRSEGAEYPVDIVYRPPRAGQSVEGAVVGAVKTAWAAGAGDILVFLPGIGEISRVAQSLEGESQLAGAALHVLHSSVRPDEQDAALAPAREGTRKIVLATSIAETSVTIDGVRSVVDSGLARVPRYSPGSGLTRLETVRVSRASAAQRAGRAGRTAPGTCYRVWDEHEQQALLERWIPEIMDADLVPLVLDLAAAGVADARDLRWIDAPPEAALGSARQLLQQLGALDAEGRITSHGRAMVKLALHPRLAHMVVTARGLGLAPLACDIAALLQERDVISSAGGEKDVDLRARLQLLTRWRLHGGPGRAAPQGADAGTLTRVLRESDRLRKVMNAGKNAADERAAGLLLAFAYPDRIALRRDVMSGRFLMRNGSGAVLPSAQALSASEALVIAELDGRKPESRIWLAAPVDVADVITHFGEDIVDESVHEWDSQSESVRMLRRERLGALVLRERAGVAPDDDEVVRLLLEQLIVRKLKPLPWNSAALGLRDRIMFARRHDEDWPDVSDSALITHADIWLAPHLRGLRGIADLKRLDMSAIISGMLDWKQRAALDEIAPSHVLVPTGSRIAVDYSDPEAPMISVRLQEMFGVAETPRVMRGKVPLTVQLLSPAQRPVQVTRDLAGFWRTSYFEVRREMRGRYPKHHWPEDPATAAPRRHGKPRGSEKA